MYRVVLSLHTETNGSSFVKIEKIDFDHITALKCYITLRVAMHYSWVNKPICMHVTATTFYEVLPLLYIWQCWAEI